jgi:hypothetical protein
MNAVMKFRFLITFHALILCGFFCASVPATELQRVVKGVDYVVVATVQKAEVFQLPDGAKRVFLDSLGTGYFRQKDYFLKANLSVINVITSSVNERIKIGDIVPVCTGQNLMVGATYIFMGRKMDAERQCGTGIVLLLGVSPGKKGIDSVVVTEDMLLMIPEKVRTIEGSIRIPGSTVANKSANKEVIVYNTYLNLDEFIHMIKAASVSRSTMSGQGGGDN